MKPVKHIRNTKNMYQASEYPLFNVMQISCVRNISLTFLIFRNKMQLLQLKFYPSSFYFFPYPEVISILKLMNITIHILECHCIGKYVYTELLHVFLKCTS